VAKRKSETELIQRGVRLGIKAANDRRLVEYRRLVQVYGVRAIKESPVFKALWDVEMDMWKIVEGLGKKAA